MMSTDDLGAWRDNRVDTTFFHARLSETDVTLVDKCYRGAEGAYQLKRVYTDHGTNPSFHKIMASMTGKLIISLVVYRKGYEY